MDGETGALAWRAGNYGIGIGSEVRELGMWDRIKIDRILVSIPPGHADVPRFMRPPARHRPGCMVS
jgi:hypothetical protein